MTDLLATAWREYARSEPAIHAWVEVSPQPPLGDGPLNGIPFGVKDIFETSGLPTEYGSSLFAGRKGSRDAALVTELRRLGGILFGKTQTAVFAYFDPPPTRNPRNVAHTPGGSSSGSAAAVAAGVVPFALGTQTMGSIVRPASFCGVAGFKPTFGALSTEGAMPFAPSLDTAGLLAASASVCSDVWRALGYAVPEDAALRFGLPEPLHPVSPEMQDAFEQAAGMLRSDYTVDRVPLPRPYEDLLAASRMVNDYEGARTQHERFLQFGSRIGEKLAQLVVRGLEISAESYRDSLQMLQGAAEEMEGVFTEYPFLLTPAAPGCAPPGLASTGDPVMNAVWTALGTPAFSLPMPIRGELPLGLQMIGRRGADGELLGAAMAVERKFKEVVSEPSSPFLRPLV